MHLRLCLPAWGAVVGDCGCVVIIVDVVVDNVVEVVTILVAAKKQIKRTRYTHLIFR